MFRLSPFFRVPRVRPRTRLVIDRYSRIVADLGTHSAFGLVFVPDRSDPPDRSTWAKSETGRRIRIAAEMTRILCAGRILSTFITPSFGGNLATANSRPDWDEGSYEYELKDACIQTKFSARVKTAFLESPKIITLLLAGTTGTIRESKSLRAWSATGKLGYRQRAETPLRAVVMQS